MTQTLTDRERIANVFKSLRKRGWFARMNFWCCQSCAWSAVPDKFEDGNVVFWHKQDNDAFNRYGQLTGDLFLAHAGKTTEVVAALVAAGFRVEWDGTDSQRVKVLAA